MARFLATMKPSHVKQLLRPVLFAVFLPCLLVYSQSCGLSYSQNNFKLVGHTIKTLPSSSSDECFSECTSKPKCNSINFDQNSQQCELNSANHLSHPESLTPSYQSGWRYVNYLGRPPAYCSDNLCSSNETCRLKNNGSGEDYECSGCKDALGMEDGRIPDSAITASKNTSIFSGKYGRLNSVNWTIENGGEYFHIDLGTVMFITEIASQGCNWGPSRGYVEKYELHHSTDNTTWTEVFYNGTYNIKANTDESSLAISSLQPKIKARFVRIAPSDWTEALSLRIELYGCSIL